MNIKELSVGDWVRCKQFAQKHKIEETHPCKVVKLEDFVLDSCVWIRAVTTFQDGKFLKYKSHIDHESIPVKHLTPIPLTPVILEKNGFAKITEDMVWAEHLNPKLAEIPTWGLKIGERPVPYLVAKMRDNNHFEITTTNIKLFRFNVEHVHQLQHVLRLAGIDKEIEL